MPNFSRKPPLAQASNRRRAALACARMGWAIFPRRPRDKQFFTHNGLQGAITDDATIRAWWDRWPDANIGVACGASDLLAHDFDTDREDYDGDGLLAHLREQYPTTEQKPGGGFHLVFRQARGPKFGDSAHSMPRGVHVRGVVGYFVAAPSAHPDGPLYEWMPERSPHELPPQPLPEFVGEMLKQSPGPPCPSVTVTPTNGNRSA